MPGVRHPARPVKLVLAALLLTAVMSVLVPLISSASNPITGYVSILSIYWVCYCVPIALVFGKGAIPVGFGLAGARRWIPTTAIALPVLVFAAGQTSGGFDWDSRAVALAVGCGLINGPLEELAWRRPFRANSGNRLLFELLGLLLFTLWHVPLYFSRGITFDGGALGLIGGAFVLGAIWTATTRDGNSVGWPIVSHTLVNITAFLPFFAANLGV